jgi:hypothetical protein
LVEKPILKFAALMPATELACWGIKRSRSHRRALRAWRGDDEQGSAKR